MDFTQIKEVLFCSQNSLQFLLAGGRMFVQNAREIAAMSRICQVTTVILSFIGFFVFKVLLWPISILFSIVLPVGCLDKRNIVTVYRVLGRKSIFPMVYTMKFDFVLWKERYVRPSDILKENLAIYSVNDKEIVFADCGDVDVFSSDTDPFLQTALFKHAQKVLVMPTAAFVKFIMSLPRPPTNVLLLPNTGRCGSTVVCQLLERAPGLRSHNEPPALTMLVYMRHCLPSHEYELYVRAVSRYMFRSSPNVTAHCLKGRSYCISQMQIIMKEFPRHHSLFLYRDSQEFCLSMQKVVMKVMAQTGWLIHVGLQLVRTRVGRAVFKSISPLLKATLFGGMPDHWGQNDEEFFALMPLTLKHFFPYFFVLWGHCMQQYREFKQLSPHIKALDFRYLQSDATDEQKRDICEQIFEQLGVPTAYVDRATEVFTQDSQEGTILAREALREEGERLNFDVRAALDENMTKILPKSNIPTAHTDRWVVGQIVPRGNQDQRKINTSVNANHVWSQMTNFEPCNTRNLAEWRMPGEDA